MTVEGRSLCERIRCSVCECAAVFPNLGRYLEREKRTDFFSEIEKVGSKPVKEVYERLLPLEKKVQKWLDERSDFCRRQLCRRKNCRRRFSEVLWQLFNQAARCRTRGFLLYKFGERAAGLDSAVTKRGISTAYLFANTLVAWKWTRPF